MGERIKNIEKLMQNANTRNKVLVIGLVGLVAIGGGAYFVSSQQNKNKVETGVALTPAPTMNVTPGQSESEKYNREVQDYNNKRTTEALQADKPFVPTIVNNQFNANSPMDTLALEDQKKRERLELEEKERAERERMEKIAADSLKPVAPPVQPIQIIAPPAVVNPPVAQEKPPKWTSNDYALIMGLQESWKNKSPNSEFNYFGQKPVVQANNTVTGNAGSTNGTYQTQSAQVSTVRVPDQKAGDILHAVLDTAINSDEPSPIMATIVSGQYKGAKLLGRFSKTGKKVVLQFTTVSISGVPTSLRINAIAIDPDTKRTSMATDVDNHYFLKYGVLMAATFLKGYAQAISNQGTTTTIGPLGNVIQTQGDLDSSQINKRALGEVGTEFASQTKQAAGSLEPTIYVDAGTPMGLLIMDDFYQSQAQGQAVQNNNAVVRR